MPISAYGTAELAGVYQELTPNVPSFFLDTFFTSSQFFNTEEIFFDQIANANRRLAPFVAPNVQGRVIKERGATMKSFKPAYVKPKSAVDMNRVLKRRPGEPLLGGMSLEQRKDSIVADILQEHKNLIHRRWEWMAAQAIVTGSVTVSGEDYPTQTVDFVRHSDNTKALTSTAAWSHASSTPITNLENWQIELQQRCGYVVNAVIMGTDAFKAYRAHAQVIALLNNQVRNGNDTLNLSALSGQVVQLAGFVGLSNLPIYVFNDFYTDDSDASQPFMDPKSILLVCREGVAGVRAFGAIMDMDANFQQTDVFTKSWRNEDPSAEYILSQSAPLMIPVRPNAVMKVKVLE